MDADVRMPELLRMRAPAGLQAAVAVAARRRHMSVSEWARRRILAGLEAEGIRLLPAGIIEITEEHTHAHARG
jgi:hypothetical protein